MVTRRAVIGAALIPVVSAFRRTNETQAQRSNIRFGYAAITWGANLTQAIDDIAAVGFRGVQPRIEAVQQFGDRPAAFKELLDRRKLTFAVLSSGNISIDPAKEREQFELHTRHARFLRDAGGLHLQVIDERPKGRAIEPGDYAKVGRLLTELGKRTADIGVQLVYHHHMNSLGEKPHEVDAVLDATDRRHVRVLFDTAHFAQAGGDPAAAIRKYREWIAVLHIKDVRPAQDAPGYQFVELGRGRVDLPACFKALDEIGFNGWGVVELDRVPDPGRTPKESAELNKRFLTDTVKLTV